MARRRRLSDNPAVATEGSRVTAPAPIAQLAGDAAAASALDSLAETVAVARAEGRLAQAIPLEAVVEDYLVRDRLGVAAESMDALEASLRTRGQQVPIEVVALDEGRYGLISGWRRLTALRRLHQQTGEDRFATVLVVQRSPATAAEAYQSMVEENEIRAGLSYYERARIVARSVEQGAFATEKAALQGLFANASRARRSKIGAFLRIYHGLDDTLRFPSAIGERLGLSLSRALETQPDLADSLAKDLSNAAPADAAAEAHVLQRAMVPSTEANASPAPSEKTSQKDLIAQGPGIALYRRETKGALTLELRGKAVDADVVARVISALDLQEA